MQFHKAGDRVVVFSRNGVDMTKRFAMIRDKLLSLPAQSAIIDAELVACDSDGKPDFECAHEWPAREPLRLVLRSA